MYRESIRDLGGVVIQINLIWFQFLGKSKVVLTICETQKYIERQMHALQPIYNNKTCKNEIFQAQSDSEPWMATGQF